MKKKQLMVVAIGVLMVAGTAFAQAPFGVTSDDLEDTVWALDNACRTTTT